MKKLGQKYIPPLLGGAEGFTAKKKWVLYWSQTPLPFAESKWATVLSLSQSNIMETYFPTAPRGNYNVLLSNDSHDCLILDFLHDANFC